MSAIPAQVTKSAGVMAAESLEGLSALAQDGSKSVAGVVKVAAVVVFLSTRLPMRMPKPRSTALRSRVPSSSARNPRAIIPHAT